MRQHIKNDRESPGNAVSHQMEDVAARNRDVELSAGYGVNPEGQPLAFAMHEQMEALPDAALPFGHHDFSRIPVYPDERADVGAETLSVSASTLAHPATPDCAPQALVHLPGVVAPNPRLNARAAASFAQVREAIRARTGQDVLAVLGDVLRAPSLRSDRPGVANRSWHKAGRAIDLNQGGPFSRLSDGAYFRVFVGAVDITAIFESHGWNRIPPQGRVSEWWHYEYHPDGISWRSAMVQVWPLEVLRQAFPEINWAAVACLRR